MSEGLRLGEVVAKLNTFAPESLAESWDNVGLLIEPSERLMVQNIFLTNDLTEEVLKEALDNKAQLIITYHPLIFSPIKRITQNSWKERIIASCLENRVAVYSPHTAWDVCNHGVNDWLINSVPIQPVTLKPIVPNALNPLIGPGRMAELMASITLRDAIESIKKHTKLKHVQVSIGADGSLDSLISTVGVCAGSGGSLLQNLQVDLFISGEMGHHPVLDASQKNTHVVLLNHSNAERGFLFLFKEKLPEILGTHGIQVKISEKDRDPLQTY